MKTLAFWLLSVTTLLAQPGNQPRSGVGQYRAPIPMNRVMGLMEKLDSIAHLQSNKAGPQGVPGTDGKDGKNGSAGTNGINGQSASVSIGSVVTLPAGSTATVTNTGTPVSAVLNFGIPKGNNGNDGAQGLQGLPGKDGKDGRDGTNGINGTNGANGSNGSNGKDGITPVFSIGTITRLPAGSTPVVTLTGSTSAPVVNFSLVDGQTGNPGPIGPAGQNGANGTNGANGITPNVYAGTSTSLAYGQAPTVTATGTPTSVTFNFGIPAGRSGLDGQNGAKGADGVTPAITIGSVSTLAYGSTPTITRTTSGTVTTLNFGIPGGQPGTNGTNGTNGNTGATGPKGDPAQLYNASGLVVGTSKIWSTTLTPSTASGQVIDISSAGFTNIIGVQAIALRNTTDAMQVPNVAIKSYTNTQVSVNIVQPNSATVTLLGVNVLSGGPMIFANTLNTITLIVTVIGT